MPTVCNSPNCGTNRKYVFRPLKNKTFRFQVKASHDVNLCLSPTSYETPHQQYEIFLGAWAGGGESGIRRNKKDDVCKVKTPDILDQNQFRGFWVVVTNHAIKVGKKNQSTPFLIHTDPSVTMNLSHYGYCTAYGSTGQWMFGDEDSELGIDMGALNLQTERSMIKESQNTMRQNIRQSHETMKESIRQSHESMKEDLRQSQKTMRESIRRDVIGANHIPARRSAGAGFTPPPAKIYPPVPPPSYYPPSQPLNNGNMKWVPCKSLSMCLAPVKVTKGGKGPYVAIAHHNGGLIPGVVNPPNFNVCDIPWGGQAVPKMDFFLLNNPENVEVVWIPARDGNVPSGAMQGGYSQTGEPLYIGRLESSGNFISGKVHPSHRVCYAPYWGKEIADAYYEVLCLRTVPLSFFGL